MIFLVALYYYGQEGRLVTAVKELQVRIVEEQYGLEDPLKLFFQPCEVIL